MLVLTRIALTIFLVSLWAVILELIVRRWNTYLLDERREAFHWLAGPRKIREGEEDRQWIEQFVRTLRWLFSAGTLCLAVVSLFLIGVLVWQPSVISSLFPTSQVSPTIVTCCFPPGTVVTGVPAPPSPGISFSSLPLIGLCGIGAVLLALSAYLKNLGVAFAGSLAFLAGATGTLSNTFKLDKLVFDLRQQQAEHQPSAKPSEGDVKILSVGFIEDFTSGCANMLGCDWKPGQTLRYLDAGRRSIGREALYESLCQAKGTILIVGRTDRIRLPGNLQRQYDSNVGLAQARAESVRNDLSNSCKSKNLFPTMMTLVGGPVKTGALLKTSKGLEGDAEDRSVQLSVMAEVGIPPQPPADHTNKEEAAGILWKPLWSILAIVLAGAVVIAILAGFRVSYKDGTYSLEFWGLRLGKNPRENK